MRLFTAIFFCVMAVTLLPQGVFAQSTAGYALTISSDAVSVGQAITVTWQTDNAPNNRDWVGLYKVGAADRSYLAFKYVNQTNPSMTFTPSGTGEYEFRYFLNNGYTRVATSEVVTVAVSGGGGSNGGGGGGYTLAIADTSVDSGQAVTVTWQTDNTPSSRDWVGLYKVGSADRSFLAYKYVNQNNPSITFTPSGSGEYEFRYFLNNGYTRVATSEVVTVSGGGGGGGNDGGGGSTAYSLLPNQTTYAIGDTAAVTWSAPTLQYRDWIGLYRTGAADTAYISYKYINSSSDVSTFRLQSSGVFEFRYFTRNSYTKVATSPTITVTPDDSVTACTLATSNITNFPPDAGPIIALGDSITFGVGATPGQNYVDELEKRLGVDIINAGVSGNTTRDALERLQRDVLSQNPSTVIVLLGGNDELRRVYETLNTNAIERGLADELDQIATERFGYNWMDKELIPRSETFDNIEEIITRIQATGATTILVGFDAGILNTQIDDNYEAIAVQTGSFYVPDIYDNVFGRPLFMSDLVHPNNRGYDVVASRILPAVACTL